MVVTCTCTALYGIDSDTDSNLLNHSKLLLCYVMLYYVNESANVKYCYRLVETNRVSVGSKD